MKFLKRKKRLITVLEINGDWLKVVQAELHGKVRKISRVMAEKIASPSDKELSGRIAGLSKELEIDSDFLVVSLPHQLAAVRNLELPSANPAEIKDMVQLQVGKQTPFTKEEIIYDYHILDTNEEGYSRVMLAIVHRDVIRRYFKILEAARLKTERIALSSEGLFAWYRFACEGRAADGPQALIDVNYDKSDFTVILKDKLIFCRNISVGALQSQNAIDEWQGKFIEETNYAIYACQNEMINKEISGAVITGAETPVANINEAVLKNKLSLSSIERIPQLKNIPITEEALEQYKVNAKDISVSYLFGLALTYPEQKINLIPPQLLIEKGVKERGRDLYLFGIYLVFILVTTSSIFLGRMYNKQQHLARLKQETLKIQEKVDKLDSMLKETDVIKRRAFTKNFSLNFIYEIHRVILPEIYLKSAAFDGKGQLSLRGTSNNMPAIIEFRNALEESKYFENVNTKFATTQKVEGKELTDFEIVCPLEAGLKEQLMESR
ncbi:MAG: pilus assembly protein PilM [Candidatus Omnitrophica bacterium]|nr:pilus assembly protein PilM [Candidatus Omnitrophota bacterium]